MNVPEWVANLLYLSAAVCFIVGLKFLSSVRTAKVGNMIGATGMLLAIVGALLHKEIVSYVWIIVAMVVGAGISVAIAQLVKMTAMPQMVGLLNGFGGAASALVASAELIEVMRGVEPKVRVEWGIATVLGILIGWVTFTGSMIAFAKLQGILPGRPIVLPGFKAINAVLAGVMVVLGLLIIVNPVGWWWFAALSLAALALGVLLVIPIGGADMPVVISLLNSYSGMAACATGFVLGNNGLIITGALVGASGIILTQIMCKAMNRSLMNVMFAAVGAEEGAAAVKTDGQGMIKSGGPEEAALLFDGARSVIIVPGYGMAVSQAQHVVAELSDTLRKKGIEVKFAIHPVAGRMPGHMNILLAEANIPYDLLMDMDAVNPLFPEADVALVVGANDITNPAARTRRDSPLYGMPILEVDKARSVIFCKRGLGAGFAGVENELFTNPKTMMLFGDAKESLKKLVAELKAH